MASEQVDPHVWRACAGNSIHVPELNSRVYYFPEGHIEQASNAIAVNQAFRTRPSIMCRVIGVVYLADPDTDEVYVKYTLQACSIPNSDAASSSGTSSVSGSASAVNANGGVKSVAKKLTKSDANNGGGFSVPRFCADTILPELNFDDDPPVQYLHIRDVHGNLYEFRHIFRGSPRRHLLTSGWSTFVNDKKLIKDDTVIFIKKTIGDAVTLFIGVRRAFKSPIELPEGLADLEDSEGSSSKSSSSSSGSGSGSGGGRGANRGLWGFSRAMKGRVPPEAVVEALEKAVSGRVFEAVYYPRPGMPEFVVEAEKVERAMSKSWTNGIRVKIAQDTYDGVKLTWYNGTVASVGMGPDRDAWPGTWWRLLQVAWDEPGTVQEVQTVNPWQVEVVAALPDPPVVPQAKRRRGVQNSGLLTDREGDPPVPSMNLGHMMGQLNPSYLNYNSIIPVGMQGARQNIYINTLSSLSNMMRPDDHVTSLLQNVVAESTNLNIGNSLPVAPLPDSHTSVQRFITADTEQSQGKLTSNGVSSFLLFGKVIRLEQPLAKGDDIKCTGYVDCTTEGTTNLCGKFCD